MTAFDRAFSLLKAPLDLESVKYHPDSEHMEGEASFIHPKTGDRLPMTYEGGHEGLSTTIYADKEKKYPMGNANVFPMKDEAESFNDIMRYYELYSPNFKGWENMDEDVAEDVMDWWDKWSERYRPSIGVMPTAQRFGIGTALYDLIDALGIPVNPDVEQSEKVKQLWLNNLGISEEEYEESRLSSIPPSWRGLEERRAIDKGFDMLKDFYFDKYGPRGQYFPPRFNLGGNNQLYPVSMQERGKSFFDEKHIPENLEGQKKLYRKYGIEHMKGASIPKTFPKTTQYPLLNYYNDYAGRMDDRLTDLHAGKSAPAFFGVNLSHPQMQSSSGKENINQILSALLHENAHSAIDEDILSALFSGELANEDFEAAHEAGANALTYPGGEDEHSKAWMTHYALNEGRHLPKPVIKEITEAQPYEMR